MSTTTVTTVVLQTEKNTTSLKDGNVTEVLLEEAVCVARETDSSSAPAESAEISKD